MDRDSILFRVESPGESKMNIETVLCKEEENG